MDPNNTSRAKIDEFMVFAEHYQFYMFDQSADPGEFSIYWDADSRDTMLLVGDRLLGIGTVRNLDVPVALEIHDDKVAGEDLDDFDHVIETSIDVPSGKLKVSGPTEDQYPAQIFDIKPGMYGVRIYFGALAEIDDEGFEGEDFYRIVIWQTDNPPATEIIKQWDQKPHMLY